MKRIHTTPTVHRTTHTTHVEAATAPAHVAVPPPPTPTEEASAAPAPTTPVLPAAGDPPVDKGPGIVFIALPPASANIPVRPKGWVPRPGEDYRGTQPKSAELTDLEGAIADLLRFTNFLQVFGTVVPPVEQIIHLLQAGLQWSTMRVSTADWDVYAAAQEGLAWGAIRIVMEALRPAFDMAVKGNSNIATMYPSLASVLAAQQVIARKGASTRAANKADVAAGKPASHGKVGKAATKAAQKAALKAQQAAEAAALAAAPVVAPAPTSPVAPVAGATPPGATNGAGNGTH